MATFLEYLETLGAFVAGLFGRAGVFLLGALLLAVPALLLAIALGQVSRFRARRVSRAGRFSFRRGSFHAPNHTWIASRGPAELMLGIDDLAREIIPSVTSVELPRPGMVVRRGEPIAVLHAGRRSVRIEAPLDGMVVRNNWRVVGDPGLVKREPYGDGWLFSLTPANTDYMRMPADEEAASWFRREAQRLEQFFEHELGLAAADGGALVASPLTSLGEEAWKRLTRAFLHEELAGQTPPPTAR
ncbi:MAG TPA: glycine cleavage system protein H [Anaeromyxobacter sp.]|nr:glycine cleavage system protein H [Anaeromyxobacter sp.]